jgi:hypothetical protein
MEIKLDRTDLGFLIQLLKNHREGLAQWRGLNGDFQDDWIEDEYVSTGELVQSLIGQRNTWDAR